MKNLKFRKCFFLGFFLLEKVFGDDLYRNRAFFDHKNIHLKKSQNLHPFKGVCPWFWSKILKVFQCFLLGSFVVENVFGDVLHRKQSFFDH